MSAAPLSEVELAALEELCAAATPGPWIAFIRGLGDEQTRPLAAGEGGDPTPFKYWSPHGTGGQVQIAEADGLYIEAACAYAPRLLAQVRAQAVEIAAYQSYAIGLQEKMATARREADFEHDRIDTFSAGMEAASARAAKAEAALRNGLAKHGAAGGPVCMCDWCIRASAALAAADGATGEGA